MFLEDGSLTNALMAFVEFFQLSALPSGKPVINFNHIRTAA
jgi:hypothetical protein